MILIVFIRPGIPFKCDSIIPIEFEIVIKFKLLAYIKLIISQRDYIVRH